MFTLSKLIRQNAVGVARQVIATIKGPASYTTGGDANTAKGLTGGRIKNADFILLNHLSYSGTYLAYTAYTNDGGASDFKIKVFVVATAAEVGNAVDLSAEKWRSIVQGN